MWALKIELACCRVERGAGGDAAPLQPVLGAAARAGFGSRGSTAPLSCMAAVSWCCPHGHPVPQQSCPGSPPAHPGMLVNAKAICCHRSWPSQAQRAHGHLPSCPRQAEFVVSVCPGVSVPLMQGSGVIPQIVEAGEAPAESSSSAGVPEQGTHRVHFLCHCGHSDMPPLLPRSFLVTPVPTPSTADVSPVPWASSADLCSLPQLLQKCLCWSLLAR